MSNLSPRGALGAMIGGQYLRGCAAHLCIEEGIAMIQSDDEKTKEDIRKLVRMLFRAENGPGGEDPDDYIVTPGNTRDSIQAAADDILAPEGKYFPIIRGRGQVDRDRAETLEKIVNGSPSFRRHVGQAEIEVALFPDDRVAIAQSLLPTSDSTTNPTTQASFRNMHVFLKLDNEWKCVAWQVTRVQ